MTEAPRNSASENTKFKPGNPHRFAPGNPGRPKGARCRATLLAEKLMSADTRAIVQAVITAARAGDMTAARIVLDRIAPIRKGRPLRFNLPEGGGTAEDVSVALAAVVEGMAAGDLTPDEAQMVASVLELRRKAIETVEIERRLAALENRDGKRT